MSKIWLPRRREGKIWPSGHPLHPRPRAISVYRWGQMSDADRDGALRAGWLPPMAGGAARTYCVYNGASAALTAALTKVATGATIKTLLQISTPSTIGLRVVEWGISFDAVAATPVECELVETGAINATVTAYNAGDVVKMNGPNDAATLMTLGTANSGFTSSAEGTITATRLGDYQLVAQQYVKQFPLGREFEVAASKFLRVRVTAAVTAGAVCYVCWEE